jgi:hypothetical protein
MTWHTDQRENVESFMLRKFWNLTEDEMIFKKRRKNDGFLSIKVEGSTSTSDVYDFRPTCPCLITTAILPAGRGSVVERPNG